MQSPLAPGASNVAVSATLAGLDCNTLYHFRAVATNGAGTTNGANASFTTAACPVLATAPTVATTTASGITAASATLNGTVSSNGRPPRSPSTTGRP